MPDHFHSHEYAGLRYEEARTLAQRKGLNPRRLTCDMVISSEYRRGRLNLPVGVDDVVLDASLG